MSSEFRPEAPAGLLDGCAWTAAIAFAIGALPFSLMFITRDAGPFGGGLLSVLPIMVCAVIGIGIVAGLSIVDRLWHRRRPFRRTVASLAAFAAAAWYLAPVGAGMLTSLFPRGEAEVTIAGITLLVLAAVLASRRHERSGALAFAAAWVLLLSAASYSVWTEMEVEVAWVGPNTIDDSPGQFAFTATRSGDFEVRFAAHSCSDGRVIATGHYEHRPDRGSNFGPPSVVELPLDVLPLKNGDLVRACVRDGFAAATRAAEVVEPASFWQRD